LKGAGVIGSVVIVARDHAVLWRGDRAFEGRDDDEKHAGREREAHDDVFVY
jgi:hypothetical protein